MPKWSFSKAPTAAPRAEDDQQQETHRHRRQHQRQMHDAVQERFAAKAARQQQGRGDGEGQRAPATATEAIFRLSSSASISSGVKKATWSLPRVYSVLGAVPGKVCSVAATLALGNSVRNRDGTKR